MSEARKLGKHAARHDDRTFKLARYTTALPYPPASVDWSKEIPPNGWPMHANDQYGCCTAASAAHLIQAWTETVDRAQVPTTEDVLAFYSRCSGFDPKKPETDRGANMLDVLKQWRKGYRTAEPRHAITAFVAVNPKDPKEVQTALWLFGGLYAGLNLPLDAQHPGPWIVTHGASAVPGSWGGHAVAIHADKPSWLRCATWGHDKILTHTFLEKYCDELFAVLSPDWVNAQKKSPSGFDVATLERDLALL